MKFKGNFGHNSTKVALSVFYVNIKIGNHFYDSTQLELSVVLGFRTSLFFVCPLMILSYCLMFVCLTDGTLNSKLAYLTNYSNAFYFLVGLIFVIYFHR